MKVVVLKSLFAVVIAAFIYNENGWAAAVGFVFVAYYIIDIQFRLESLFDYTFKVNGRLINVEQELTKNSHHFER